MYGVNLNVTFQKWVGGECCDVFRDTETYVERTVYRLDQSSMSVGGTIGVRLPTSTYRLVCCGVNLSARIDSTAYKTDQQNLTAYMILEV